MSSQPSITPPLPARGVAEEDAFIWRAVEEPLPDDILVGLVGEALAAGRPQLAARLVGLLPDSADTNADVDRARSAARLFLQDGATAAAWNDEIHDFLGRWKERRARRQARRERWELASSPWLDPFRRRGR